MYWEFKMVGSWDLRLFARVEFGAEFGAISQEQKMSLGIGESPTQNSKERINQK